MTQENAAPRKPLIVMPGGGHVFNGLGVIQNYKVTSADTGGEWTAMEYTAVPRFAGPAPHWHKVLQEAAYILEGMLTFHMDDRTAAVSTGGFVYIPPGTVHTFANETDAPARMLLFMLPGGFEDYFKDLQALIKSEPTWPPADMSKLLELMAKYDTYPPPVR